MQKASITAILLIFGTGPMVCLVHFFETHIIKLANPKNENNHRLKAVGTVGFSRGQITQAEESEAVVSQRVHYRWIASEIWRFYETWCW